MDLDIGLILKSFKTYTDFSVGRSPSAKEFLLNIEEKEKDSDFIGDMEALLRSEIEYDQEKAFDWLKEEIIERI
jgi:hypothetical protein